MAIKKIGTFGSSTSTVNDLPSTADEGDLYECVTNGFFSDETGTTWNKFDFATFDTGAWIVGNTLAREIFNVIARELDNQVLDYDGDHIYKNDQAGNLVIFKTGVNNPLALDKVNITPFSLQGLTPETQPFKDRNLNFYNVEMTVVFRVEDRYQAEVDLEKFAFSFYNKTFDLNGTNSVFKVPTLSSFVPTVLHNGEWVIIFSTNVKVTTGKNVVFGDEIEFKISDDNITFETMQVAYKPSRGLDLEPIQRQGDDKTEHLTLRKLYQGSISYVYDNTSTVQVKIRTFLENNTKEDFFIKVIEEDDSESTKTVLIESASRDVQKGGYIVYDVTFKEKISGV